MDEIVDLTEKFVIELNKIEYIDINVVNKISLIMMKCAKSRNTCDISRTSEIIGNEIQSYSYSSSYKTKDELEEGTQLYRNFFNARFLYEQFLYFYGFYRKNPSIMEKIEEDKFEKDLYDYGEFWKRELLSSSEDNFDEISMKLYDVIDIIREKMMNTIQNKINNYDPHYGKKILYFLMTLFLIFSGRIITSYNKVQEGNQSTSDIVRDLVILEDAIDNGDKQYMVNVENNYYNLESQNLNQLMFNIVDMMTSQNLFDIDGRESEDNLRLLTERYGSQDLSNYKDDIEKNFKRSVEELMRRDPTSIFDILQEKGILLEKSLGGSLQKFNVELLLKDILQPLGDLIATKNYVTKRNVGDIYKYYRLIHLFPNYPYLYKTIFLPLNYQINDMEKVDSNIMYYFNSMSINDKILYIGDHMTYDSSNKNLYIAINKLNSKEKKILVDRLSVETINDFFVGEIFKGNRIKAWKEMPSEFKELKDIMEEKLSKYLGYKVDTIDINGRIRPPMLFCKIGGCPRVKIISPNILNAKTYTEINKETYNIKIINEKTLVPVIRYEMTKSGSVFYSYSATDKKGTFYYYEPSGSTFLEFENFMISKNKNEALKFLTDKLNNDDPVKYNEYNIMEKNLYHKFQTYVGIDPIDHLLHYLGNLYNLDGFIFGFDKYGTKNEMTATSEIYDIRPRSQRTKLLCSTS